jgi:hypothetical protein
VTHGLETDSEVSPLRIQRAQPDHGISIAGEFVRALEVV